MDNRAAIVIVLAIVIALGLDHFVFHWGLPVFFGKVLASVTEWLAFWR